MGKRPISQDDLARRLGLTQMTVSLALSGKGRVAVETRERVAALATKLGYRPNSMARRVHEGRYRGLALLGSASRPAFNVWDQDFHMSVGAALAERSWHLTESWLPGEGLADPATVTGLLDRLLADAVLVHDVGPQPPVVEALLERHRVPAVWVNTGRASDAVDFADAQAGADAIAHLLAQGYRQPAMVLDSPPDNAGAHVSQGLRAEGWRRGCVEAGIAPRFVHPEPVEAWRMELTSALRQALAGNDRPDAIACYSYKVLFVARLVSADLGLRIGRDLGLMCFAKAADAEIDRAYTVCAQDYQAMAREAVAMAWRRLDTGKVQPKVLIPMPLMKHGTTDRSS